MSKQLKKIREMVEELLVEEFNDISVAQTLGYIDACIDTVENNV